MRILVAGDFCPQNRVADCFENGDFQKVLGDFKRVATNADYSIVNFECPITSGNEGRIPKQGPHLHCSERGLEAVKWAGINCVTLANNHFLDYGEEGVAKTLEVCEKYGIDTVGGGINLQMSSETLFRVIEGYAIAIINCCEHEFSIATLKKAGANPLNAIQQYYAITEAKKKADYVLVIIHGGHEMFQLPSPRMKELYHFFIDVGADAVVNHHQHCYSGFEIYKGKPIFYGLGNLLFDWLGKRNGIWNEGYMVSLEFTKSSKNPSFEVIPYTQCNDTPNVVLNDNKDKEAFSRKVNELSEIIVDDDKLNIEYEKWLNNSSYLYKSIFQPYRGKFLNYLFMKGYLPSFVPKRLKYRIINYIECESHLDKLRYVVKEIL